MDYDLSLPAELTVRHVAALRTQWLATIATRRKAARRGAAPAPALQVDAQGLVEIDGAGLQLLLSLANSLSARARTLCLHNAPAPLIAACETLGVAPQLLGKVTGEPQS